MNPQRPLPRRLRAEESWETWIETADLPDGLGEEVFSLARVRLSNGRILRSQRNTAVPSTGFVPGN